MLNPAGDVPTSWTRSREASEWRPAMSLPPLDHGVTHLLIIDISRPKELERAVDPMFLSHPLAI